jgi:hypothetical protein
MAWQSFRTEDMMDISLGVKDHATLLAALQAFHQTELLAGPNQYRSDCLTEEGGGQKREVEGRGKREEGRGKRQAEGRGK